MGKQTNERRKAAGLCVTAGDLELQKVHPALSAPDEPKPKDECTIDTTESKGSETHPRLLAHTQGRVRQVAGRLVREAPRLQQTRIREPSCEPCRSSPARPDPICVYCGCDDIRFLEINHKEGGGAKEVLVSGSNFYWAIIKGRRPVDDLEITCGLDNKLHFYRLKYGDDANRFLVSWKTE